jgi:2-polyprenyl-6-hydroxyphenyl methylase/3-demethylubiquinone-9 3-methyltransferase
MNEASEEIARGERFDFGENWSRFLRDVDEERIGQAVASLTGMLGVTTLDGKRFLDAGSGSGMFSLAARRLGATVHSFDFDARPVACTAELRRRYSTDDVQRGLFVGRSAPYQRHVAKRSHSHSSIH